MLSNVENSQVERELHLICFTKVTRNDRDCAQCSHYSVVMSNASLRLSKLKNHCDKDHTQKKDDDRVRCDLEATLSYLEFMVEVKPTLQCSYEVAYRIAKCKKPHTIAKKLIKPCTEKIVKIMIGSGAKKKIQQVSLSNDTIRRRINDMAANVCQQVCSEIKQSTLQASIQLGESTDSALESHLIAFA